MVLSTGRGQQADQRNESKQFTQSGLQKKETASHQVALTVDGPTGLLLVRHLE